VAVLQFWISQISGFVDKILLVLLLLLDDTVLYHLLPQQVGVISYTCNVRDNFLKGIRLLLSLHTYKLPHI
jgi:hypothetical protein